VCCGAKGAQVTQNQGGSQSYDRYPHALISLSHTACPQLGYPAMLEFVPLPIGMGHQTRLNRNVSFVKIGRTIRRKKTSYISFQQPDPAGYH
jgi:hypothetical protein